MKKVGKMSVDGHYSTTNGMLDDVIETVQEKHGINNDEMIKELAIQKIEYGRRCIHQIINSGKTAKQMLVQFDYLDGQLQKRIKEITTK